MFRKELFRELGEKKNNTQHTKLNIHSLSRLEAELQQGLC